MDNTNVIIFKSITSFVSDLNSEFGTKFKNIQMYNRLLEKTGIVNIGPVNKHIDSFRTFFNSNKSGMEEQNVELFTETKISYNDRVFIDIKIILALSSKEVAQIIWKHLLVIWNLIDPTSQAKQILKNSLMTNEPESKETEFLSNIIEKVESAVGDKELDTNNPMAAVSTLMTSGVFTNLISDMQSGLQSGNLDIGKLMSGITGMIGKLSSSSDGGDTMPPEFAGMMNMMTGMMGGGGIQSSSTKKRHQKRENRRQKRENSGTIEVIEETTETSNI